MTIIKSVSLSPEFAKLQEDHNISLSEACRVGIAIILAEKNIQPYDNNLNVYKRMRFFQKETEKNMEKVEELRQELQKREEIEMKKEGIKKEKNKDGNP